RCSPTRPRRPCSRPSGTSPASSPRAPSCGSRTASRATSRAWPPTSTSGTTPAACARAPTRRSPTPTALDSGSTTPPARYWPTAWTCSASPRRSGCEALMATNMRAHEAGILHADGYGTAPQWLPYPEDVTELMPELWASNVRRSRSGEITVAGLPVTEIAREFGTAAYVMDEGDFRARARAFRDDFTAPFAALAGADVYYAGKAFLCTAVARWIKEEGLFLDTCSGGELAVAQRVDFPPERVALHGNNKSREEIHRALSWGIGRIVVDSFAEIDRVAQIATELGVVAPVMVRVTVGVEAHTHEFIATAHEDQKFGFSLAGGQAREAVDAIVAKGDRLHLLGLHSHIGSQIFDTSGFEIAARRLIALHTEVADEHGIAMPEMDLGGGYGIAYTSENT